MTTQTHDPQTCAGCAQLATPTVRLANGLRLCLACFRTECKRYKPADRSLFVRGLYLCADDESLVALRLGGQQPTRDALAPLPGEVFSDELVAKLESLPLEEAVSYLGQVRAARAKLTRLMRANRLSYEDIAFVLEQRGGSS
jgi:hypothetical protein